MSQPNDPVPVNTTARRPRTDSRGAASARPAPEELQEAIEALRGQERLDAIIWHCRARGRSGLSRRTYFRLMRSMPAAERAWTRYTTDAGHARDEPLPAEDRAHIWCEEIAMRGSEDNPTVVVAMFGEASDGRKVRLEYERADWGTIVQSRGPIRVCDGNRRETLPFGRPSPPPVPPIPAPVVPPPVPAGFVKCDVCGEYDDTSAVRRVSCRCRGPLCRRCGRNHVNKSGSNSYDERTGRIEHWFHYADLMPCRECRAKTEAALARARREDVRR